MTIVITIQIDEDEPMATPAKVAPPPTAPTTSTAATHTISMDDLAVAVSKRVGAELLAAVRDARASR